MKLNLVRKRDAPQPPYTGVFVCITVQSVPYLISSIWLHSQKYWFTNDLQARIGRRKLYEDAAHMLTECGTEIVEAVDRVYRLIDSNQNGTIYSSSGDGTPESPIVISPSIPTVPITTVYDEPGQRAHIDEIRLALRNLLNGETSTTFTDPRNFRQQLDDIKTALQAMGAEDDQVEELLNLILLALG